MKYITLYTAQYVAGFEVAMQRGYLCGDKDHIWDIFQEPYEWMREQMKSRIENYSGDYPVWAWPDKNEVDRTSNESEYGVLLTIRVPINRVLISDFTGWEYVLVNGYIHDNNEEYSDDWSQEEREASWQKIFDMNSNLEGFGKLYQACVDHVYPDEIVSIEVFKYQKQDISFR